MVMMMRKNVMGEKSALDQLLKMDTPKSTNGAIPTDNLIEAFAVISVTCNACQNTAAPDTMLVCKTTNDVKAVGKQFHSQFVIQRKVLCTKPKLIIGIMNVIIDAELVK